METISSLEWYLHPAGSKYITELDLDKWKHGLCQYVNACYTCKLKVTLLFKKGKKVDGCYLFC